MLSLFSPWNVLIQCIRSCPITVTTIVRDLVKVAGSTLRALPESHTRALSVIRGRRCYGYTHAISDLTLLLQEAAWSFQSAQAGRWLKHFPTHPAQGPEHTCRRIRNCQLRVASQAYVLTQIWTCVHSPMGWMRWGSLCGFIHPVGG